MGAYQSGFTSIDNRNTLPEEVTMLTNYPNPFNNSTSVIVGLEKSSDVEISIVNVLGQQIETLHNGSLNVGRHIFNWDAGSVAQNITSGVYFVVLKSDEVTRVRKMVLLK